MGGKALKKVKTKRYNKDEFNKLVDFVKKFTLYSNSRIHIVDSYFSKETFGDIDVLVEMSSKNSIENIIKNIDYNEIVYNGNVVSFDINNDFQCDLIKVHTEDWEFAKAFFAFNDLGLVIGRMARNIGLTFGFDGLKYKIYSEDKSAKLGTIFITKDPKIAFELLDLDWNTFLKGFNTMNDVFDYTASSKFFVKRIFDDDFQNSPNKRRDNKRQSLHLMNEYIKTKNDIPYNLDPSFKKNIIDFINSKFPDLNFKQKINEILFKYKKDKLASEIFSGKDILFLFNENDTKKLGMLLNSFKDTFCDYTNARLLLGKEKMIDKFKKFTTLQDNKQKT